MHKVYRKIQISYYFPIEKLIFAIIQWEILYIQSERLDSIKLVNAIENNKYICNILTENKI